MTVLLIWLAGTISVLLYDWYQHPHKINFSWPSLVWQGFFSAMAFIVLIIIPIAEVIRQIKRQYNDV